MCIIVAKPAGIDFPPLETLKRCEENNGDGCGLAYHKKGTKEVSIKKNFKDVDDMAEFISANLSKDDSAIIHFRIATSGLVDHGNRHPFPITDDVDLLRNPEMSTSKAVAHNGIFSQWNNIKDSELSDTQMFIKNILADPLINDNLITSKSLQILMSDFLGNNKLAILHNNGQITIWGKFEKEDDIFYSNTTYKTKKFTQIIFPENYYDDWAYSHYSQLQQQQEVKLPDNEDRLLIDMLCDECMNLLHTTTVIIDNEPKKICRECIVMIEQECIKCECGNYNYYEECKRCANKYD